MSIAQDKQECETCKQRFPTKLINKLIVEDSAMLVCPICALKSIRKRHGTPNFMFRTPANVRSYQAAVSYLKRIRL